MQTTSHLLMIRPVNFRFNAETAVNNAFQVESKNTDTQAEALREFDRFVSVLRAEGVDVTVVEDTPEPNTPDSIFPNNWISFHDDGSLVLYPMYAVNRRAERKPQVIEKIAEKFSIGERIDLTRYESEDLFLEGTGSMVLDRESRIAYACISPRTNQHVLADFCARMKYKAVVFDATDQDAKPIYHTNVMMCVAREYVVVCLESIRDQAQLTELRNAIVNSGKQLVEISLDQMNKFAGNMLQVENARGERLLVMSSQAFHSLNTAQLKVLEGFNRIVHSPLTSIEANGGGSARCMMAEIHLPVKA